MLELNESNQAMFGPEAAGMSFEDFRLTKEGKKMSGLTGGIQGDLGTIAGLPYKANGFLDRLVESFAGTHDTIGGGITGLYDEQGNTTRGLTDAQNIAYDMWNVMAIAPSAPFALSEFLPVEAWKVLDVLIKVR